MVSLPISTLFFLLPAREDTEAGSCIVFSAISLRCVTALPPRAVTGGGGGGGGVGLARVTRVASPRSITVVINVCLMVEGAYKASLTPPFSYTLSSPSHSSSYPRVPLLHPLSHPPTRFFCPFLFSSSLCCHLHFSYRLFLPPPTHPILLRLLHFYLFAILFLYSLSIPSLPSHLTLLSHPATFFLSSSSFSSSSLSPNPSQ